jgi:MFS family permease
MALLVCLAMLMCNFLAAGPSAAIVEITIDFFHTPPTVPAFGPAIAKIAYFFTSAALLQGVGNLIWMPLIVKYGRRPVYLSSFTIYTACAIWCGVAKSYNSELAARIIMGFAAGSGECLAPLTIADIFFLHERGLVMACYTAALSCGVALGIIISGLITIDHSWRYIYYVATALIGALTILVFFTMPETSFNRSPVEVSSPLQQPPKVYTDKKSDVEQREFSSDQVGNVEAAHVVAGPTHKKQSYIHSLRIFSGVMTNESLVKIFMRPVALLILPPVLWATLVMSVTIGFLVAISSNFASAFNTTYGFAPWQSGLCFVSGIIGSLLGIFFGGRFSDWTANILTSRNGGIREPEMRLPAITLGLIASPLALILYGVGIQRQLHWIVPTIGLGLRESLAC